MPFLNSVREEALVKAKRRCCICHEFAGRSINVHHIKQEADGGENTLENAIVLCLRCHAEAGHFNPRHPLGTKYSPTELIKHRDAWFEACQSGRASYSSSIDVTVKTTYQSSELHKYALIFVFQNGSKHTVSGWKLDIFVPYAMNVSICDIEEHSDADIDGKRYRKYQISSKETLYLGESIQITDTERTKLEYDVDHKIYIQARSADMKIVWRFYSSSEPPIIGELPWVEIQRY